MVQDDDDDDDDDKASPNGSPQPLAVAAEASEWSSQKEFIPMPVSASCLPASFR